VDKEILNVILTLNMNRTNESSYSPSADYIFWFVVLIWHLFQIWKVFHNLHIILVIMMQGQMFSTLMSE